VSDTKTEGTGGSVLHVLLTAAYKAGAEDAIKSSALYLAEVVECHEAEMEVMRILRDDLERDHELQAVELAQVRQDRDELRELVRDASGGHV
jgi:hypothetical protein